LHGGADVIIGSRSPNTIDAKLPATAYTCLRREVRIEQLQAAQDWHAIVADVDVVLNCVGVLRQRGPSTYDRVHHRGPAALAEACGERGKRLVHVSALGLHDGARSRFLTSKLDGERALRASSADWIIARPSLLDGVGGFGASWLRGVAKLPFFFTPTNANGQIAALHVEDLGQALARLSLANRDELRLEESREFDLGGERSYVFRDYIRALRRRHSQRQALCVPVPAFAARLFAHVCDLVHFSPFSFGHWELLARDNMPAPNRLPELLQRPPRNVATDS
jgi:uncharacterized protein YbjT (DUF2867 family)